MSSKDAILRCIREALRETAPRPESGCARGETKSAFRQWLPEVGATPAAQWELFARNSADLRTEFHLLASPAEVVERARALARENDWRRVATHAGDLTDAVATGMGVPVLRTDGGYDVGELEQCDAGITQCDALVAQTGSVLITSRSAGGRALSILPPHHIVLATRAQLVPDLPAAYAVLRERYGSDYPSLISFITGPSRTGDIERILVLGAHGPKRLTVFCA